MTQVLAAIYAHQDEKYGDFIAKSIPTLPRERFIGVRSPEYKKIVRELQNCPEVGVFLDTLPHFYYEEYALHSAFLCRMKDYDACMKAVERFLPDVDNWAVCDGLNPSVFKKHRAELKKMLPEWIASEAPYTRRFGMRMLMAHFLEEDFDPTLLQQPAELRSEEYYVNMMTAWLFAEALARQWKTAINYIEARRLDKWTHNKTI